jgi:hypothetical protein
VNVSQLIGELSQILLLAGDIDVYSRNDGCCGACQVTGAVAQVLLTTAGDEGDIDSLPAETPVVVIE